MRKPKPKKRGRKPGVKVGPYKKKHKTKSMTLDDYSEQILKPMLHRKAMGIEEAELKYTPAPVLTLCGQLEDAILLLETRISNAIAKINSLM